MPRIPGVSDRPASRGSRFLLRLRTLPKRVVVPVAIALAVGAALVWLALRNSRPTASAESARVSPTAGAPAPRTTGSQGQAVPTVMGRGRIATLDELAKPWDAKKFIFVRPGSREEVPSLVVRLPGGPADSNASYWAFALQAPFGQCELEYVTDLGKLARQYGYRASHPMVADPCSRTVYDPLKVGTVPGGAWVRGEVVQGAGIRPPFAVEVRVEGRQLLADRIE